MPVAKNKVHAFAGVASLRQKPDCQTAADGRAPDADFFLSGLERLGQGLALGFPLNLVRTAGISSAVKLCRLPVPVQQTE